MDSTVATIKKKTKQIYIAQNDDVVKETILFANVQLLVSSVTAPYSDQVPADLAAIMRGLLNKAVETLDSLRMK